MALDDQTMANLVRPHSSRSNLDYGPFNAFCNSQNLCSSTYFKTFLIFFNRFARTSICNVFIYAYLDTQ
jgi:hypothetical protein